jgi:cation diffusion facilitator family transporter
VIIALAVNLVVAIIKAVAGVVVASAGLLAEAAHSVGDCTTELFLVTALRRSRRAPDERHPFGYGKERYFWSFLAALTIFALGAGYSFYEGFSTILAGEADPVRPTVGYVVIGLSIAVEAISLRQASSRVRRESTRAELTVREYVRDPNDPTTKSVLLEDVAAMLGLVLALAGLALRQLTGRAFWDGIAALAIGALLVAVAFELARTNVGLLIGKQANPKMVDKIGRTLADQAEVLSVIEVRTMMIGTDQVLVCARIDYVETLSATQAEHAAIRLHDVLKERFADIEDVFLEAVPRGDAGLREAATARS